MVDSSADPGVLKRITGKLLAPMCRLWGGFKGRWKAVLVWAGCGFFAVEIIAIGLAVNKMATYGVPADVARPTAPG